MQAITTKFHGPTNIRGSRISATAEAGRITLSWDSAKNPEANHLAAAVAFAQKFGCKGRIVGGDLPRANPAHMAFVFVNDLSPSAEV